MADFIKTLTNSLRVFGVGYSTKWGNTVPYQTMVWGTSKWGEGTNPQAFQVSKVIQETQVVTWDKSSAQVTRNFSLGTFSPTFDISAGQLLSGQWAVVFPSNTINLEERDDATWTESSRPDVTFTCLSVASTTWNEV
jgi:hypothetical protein